MNGNNTNKIRVAVYCRIGNIQENDEVSYRLQEAYYRELVKAHEDWKYCGLYIDRGAGTRTWPRPEFDRLLGDCRAGKIDLIITKSVSRLYRNVVDAITTIRELLDLTPPVGVYFENEGFNTLDAGSNIFLHLLQWMAAGESRMKSVSLPRGHSYGYYNHKLKPRESLGKSLQRGDSK